MVKKTEKTNIKRDYLEDAESEKKFGRFLEEAKLTNDYMKHLATLDTGSILIMATFFQRITKSGSEILFFIAAFAFFTSLIGVVFSQRALINFVSDSANNLKRIPSDGDKISYKLAANLAYFSFLIAIGGLLAFIFYVLIV